LTLGTRATYESGFNALLDFASTARPPIDIYNPSVFQQELFWVGFVTWLADYRRIRMLSGRHYLYGIQTLLLEAGCHVSILRLKLVRRALKAWGRREGPSDTRPKVPITVSVLSSIRRFFNLSSHDDRVIWAMACLAVYGLLRCGEVTLDAFDKLRYPIYSDWSYDAKGFIGRFRLGSSKTDVFFQGTYIYIAANNSPTCPMAAMRHMFSLAPFKWLPGTPLFSFDGIKPITRNVFLNNFRTRAQSVIDTTSFSGHSFRRGGAQSLYDAGTPLEVIRDIGRWKSDIIMRRYYGYSVEQLSNISLNVSKGFTRQLLDFHLLKAPAK
jgi:hypothetical protein